MERCWNRFKTKIPISQAAYQSGRSTIEQVFTLKITAKKAIISEKYDIFLLMLDMSKAFDTINRKKLMEELQEILTESEMHIMDILINDVIINIKFRNTTVSDILTAIGICQGDCLSALLFILYLGAALRQIPTEIQREDHTGTLWSQLDWLIDRDHHQVEIDPKYADDIRFLRSCENKLNQVERVVPNVLKEKGLIVNTSKTEKHKINKESKEWKKCKYLGYRRRHKKTERLSNR